MSEKSLNIDSNSSKKRIDVSKYYKHITKTFLTSLGVLFLGLLFFFLLIRFLPGNPYSLSEGNPIYEHEVTRLALDKNIIIQFFFFLGNLFLGYWGNSYYLSSPTGINIIVQGQINEMRNLQYFRFLELIFASFAISLFFGIYFGYLVSKFKNKKKGKIIRVLIILLWAIPIVGFGYIFQYIFGNYGLQWLPGCSGASYAAFLDGGDFITYFPLIDCLLSGKGFWDRILYLMTPVSTLNLIMIPIVTYFTYKLIEHFKSSKEIPNFTGKLGFFYNIIVSSAFFIYPIVCTHDLTAMFLDGLYCEYFNILILSIYFFLITFFIFNLLFNIIICGITLYLEHKEINTDKISKIKDNSAKKSNNSDINENIDLKSTPKKNIIQRNGDVRILISTIIISLLILIIFLLLRVYFLIFLGIFGILICIPLIFKNWRLKLTSKKDIENINSNSDQQSSNEEKSNILNNRFSKRVIIIGGILIIISIFGIGIYGWEASDKNIFKTQTALIIGIFSSLISIVGVFLGFLSAYFGKWVKKLINNLVLIFISIPFIMILILIIEIIGIADFNIIWILGLISIPIVTHITAEIISSEMKKENIEPAFANGKNQRKMFSIFIRNLIFPITGVLCLNIGLSIILFEGYNTMHGPDFFDPSYTMIGEMLRSMRTKFSDTSAFFLLLIPMFLLILIVSGFMLLGLGLYNYNPKKMIPKEE